MPAGDRERILVLANETLASGGVVDEVVRRAGDRDADVLVVAPALPKGRLHHFTGADAAGARQRAEARLQDSVDALVSAGYAARGMLGDASPLMALDDALREFAATQIVISTHPPSRSHWLERGIVDRARSERSVPVHHIIVDVERAEATAWPDPRPGARDDESIRLYRCAGYEEAMAIRRSGFLEERVAATDGQRSGVWMVAARAGRGDDDGTVFAIDAPLRAVRPYEREPGFHDERRFFVPAQLLRDLGPAIAVDDDTVE